MSETNDMSEIKILIRDPDTHENEKSFGIDGDGSFYIKEIKLNKKIVKFKNNRLLSQYLYSLEE